MEITIKLDFIERDTLLACLRDLKDIKQHLVKIANCEKERSVCKAQIKTIENLYNTIFEQKMEENK